MNVAVRIASLISVTLVCLVISACGTPEDPARVALRARLREAPQLSPADLGRLMDEASLTVAGKTVRFKTDKETGELDQEQRELVLGMLTDRGGVYDEGMRTEGGTTWRVLNGPALSDNSEYSAIRKLLLDPDTFAPRRFEFGYDVAGVGGYSFDLVIDQ